jgi:hypothetical protein
MNLQQVLIKEFHKNDNREDLLKIEFENLKKSIKKYEFENKTEYKYHATNNNLEIEPEKKYADHGWINYYDFINLDTSKFPTTIDEWREFCLQNNINSNNYIIKCRKYKLPIMPEDFYDGFTNIQIELEGIHEYSNFEL